jgi:hypothetical protein
VQGKGRDREQTKVSPWFSWRLAQQLLSLLFFSYRCLYPTLRKEQAARPTSYLDPRTS